MNKKGFTLVEVIATIAIILILLLLVVPNVRTILNRNNLKLWKETEKRLVDAGRKYLIMNNIDKIEPGETITVTKQQLIEEELTTELYNLSNKNNICDAYVTFSNSNGDYIEKAYITCENGYQTEE